MVIGDWVLGISYRLFVVGCGSERSVDPAESGIASCEWGSSSLPLTVSL